MGLRLSFGVGPLRASIPLTSRRRRRRKGRGSSGALLLGVLLLGPFVLMFYMIAFELWLVWAFIALPVAGIARLSHNDDLAQRMIRSLKWKMPRLL